MKILTHDTVLVTAGKDKGKTGKVMRVLIKQGRVVVEKVNIITKHIKKTAQHAGERIKLEASIDASNVKLICPNCKKPTRIGYTKLKTGKKTRTCKKCAEGIANPNSKKSK
jgi:large subunit ribosomal protein L24